MAGTTLAVAAVVVVVTVTGWLFFLRQQRRSNNSSDNSSNRSRTNDNYHNHPTHDDKGRRKQKQQQEQRRQGKGKVHHHPSSQPAARGGTTRSTTSQKKHGSCKAQSPQSPPPSHLQLPSHLERELSKERRRHELVSLFSMKKPMYDNIFMQAPDGHVLCTISLKKAQWYVKKQLAVWLNDNNDNNNNNHQDDNDNNDDNNNTKKNNTQPNTKTTIRLNFYPSNSRRRPPPPLPFQSGSSSTTNATAVDDSIPETSSSPPPPPPSLLTFPHKDPRQEAYNKSKKANQCVVCGSTQEYMRHYVVPYCYRTLFPPHFKTHLPHDVVLLCGRNCHYRAERAAHLRMQRIERALRQQQALPPTTAMPSLVDVELHAVASRAQALLQWKDQLPRERIQEYTRFLQSFYYSKNDANNNDDEATATAASSSSQSSSSLELTDHVLYELSQIDYRRPNPNYISGPQLVQRSLMQKGNKHNSSSDQKKSDRYRGEEDGYDESKITHFIQAWRQHFVDTMHPRYLPTGWSVDSPVQCDARVPQNDDDDDDEAPQNNQKEDDQNAVRTQTG
ncbi:hypothetical protein ACA910_003466 [Epithemia clementina (nom. ined.)]